MSNNHVWGLPPQAGHAPGPAYPPPGSDEEKQVFRHLQAQFVPQFELEFPNDLAPKTVVIIPSLSLDQQILEKIDGIVHYEERMLCMLMLLRMPRTHVVYVTSMPIDPVVVDYYLHLLPGITGYHARRRLTLLSCYDASPVALTQKVLNRPRLLKRIKASIPDEHVAHMACFNVTGLERTLSVRLQLPIYGCDPDLFHLGNKSNGRKLFRECGLQVPDGFEDLQSEVEIAEALAALKVKHPELKKAVVKINDGFSGDGNAIFHFDTNEENDLHDPVVIQSMMPRHLAIVAQGLKYQEFIKKIENSGGIAEVFIESDVITSPSVQCRINPLGMCDVISTHDQVLGGQDDQVFLGAHFPAREEYASVLGKLAMPLCSKLSQKGVMGRFSIDFLSVKENGKWQHYALEINLRKGGTTHPFLMLMFLTDGKYHAETGHYLMQNGEKRCYFSTDNFIDASFKGLTPHDLIEIAMDHKLMFNGATQQGVMFHMISALSQYGKMGVVAFGSTHETAYEFYEKTLYVLRKESLGW